MSRLYNHAETWIKTHPLHAGILVSVVLLIFFMSLKEIGSTSIDLEIHWLAIVVLPLLLAMFLGGYITDFKGFGVELSRKLTDSEKVKSLADTVAADLHELPAPEQAEATEKGDQDALGAIEHPERYKRLIFRSGRTSGYSASMLRLYLDRLENVEFLEARDTEDRFLFAVGASNLRGKNDAQQKAREDFLKSLTSTRPDDLHDVIHGVPRDTDLVRLLQACRSAGSTHIAVVDEDGIVSGYLTTKQVETAIADAVLAADERQRVARR